MDQHIKIVAILFLVFGVLGLLIALGIVLAGAGAVATILSQGQSNDEQAAAGIVGTCATVFAVLFGIMAIPSLVSGWGLLKRKAWSRVLAIIVAIISLVAFPPFTTAVGVYALWVMFNDETRRLLTV